MQKLREIDCFLLDMDGTFYLGEQILPGSLAFLEGLRERGKRFLFLTNNSSHNADFYVERLGRMGCAVTREDVMTSGIAAAEMLHARHPNARVYVLGNDFLKRELAEAGVRVTEDAPDVLLAGYDTTLTYEKLAQFCLYLREGLPYYATHGDFNCPSPRGFLPDLGSMMALMEASTGRKPDGVAGKPELPIMQAAAARTGVPQNRMAMVGDRLYTDIATGLRHGLLSVLVLSGETKRDDLADTPFVPDLVFDGLDGMLPYL